MGSGARFRSIPPPQYEDISAILRQYDTTPDEIRQTVAEALMRRGMEPNQPEPEGHYEEPKPSLPTRLAWSAVEPAIEAVRAAWRWLTW